MNIAWCALTPGGLALAEKLRAQIGAGVVHDAKQTASPAAHMRELFAAGNAVVGICAAGILIRAVAPLLKDKKNEPPLIAVAENGGVVVPLLGGHRGGNALAQKIAAALGAAAAVTTMGEVRFGIALDAPPPGWTLANPQHYKKFAARLAAGGKVKLHGEAGWLAESALPFCADGALTLTATAQAAPGGEGELVFHPKCLAVGVGCERGVESAELAALVERALRGANLAPQSVAVVASIALKADEPAVHAVAAALGAPARFFDAGDLEAQAHRLKNPSAKVFAETGCHGVAEGAALAAGGGAAELIIAKQKSARATCAVARAAGLIDADAAGRARGCLSVVGIGPGDAASRTPAAAAAIAAAEDVVGYTLYLDLLGAPAAGQRRHDSAIGDERGRVRAALELAAAGRRVALVCSGDAGIYALASLVFEEWERGMAEAAWRTVEVRVVPGVSAMQAAAARAGAPLGHDFCAVSLSDLLTPWGVIARRVQAAADGDFVVAFYNPASRKRARLLDRARDILLQQRGAETPVVVARNLGRGGETVVHTTLGELRGGEVDMFTIVVVGASGSRTVQTVDGARMWTPRGYESKK